MIEKVEMWRTTDGKLHETPKKAEDHNLNRFCELIDKQIQLHDRLTASEKFKLITMMFPDYVSALDFVVKANKIFEV